MYCIVQSPVTHRQVGLSLPWGVIASIALTAMLGTSSLQARSFRVSQIPNGNVNGCANCHVSAGGGGTRTPFGNAVFAITGTQNRPFWSPTLAALDSDGDSFSNGEELGDPDGDFADINPSSVSNPGVASSVPNLPPTISITSPASGTTFTAPASITIATETGDADGTVTRVDFLNGRSVIGTVTSAPFTFVWENVQVGTYTVTAKATDNGGATTTSSAIQVVVESTPATPVDLLTPAVSGGIFSFTFQSETDQQYTVKFRDSIGTGTWQTLTTITGDGTTRTVEDPAGSSGRFYQVVTE